VLLQVTFPIYLNNSRYALVGDFNAKTSDLPDFCCPDENFLDIINLRYDEEILKYFYDQI
jgi:hypothetical protein